MKNQNSLLSQVDKNKLAQKIAEARNFTEENGMIPVVYGYKDLDGVLRVGFGFKPVASKVGDRFHIDHGVGICRNEDGEILWIYAPEEKIPDVINYPMPTHFAQLAAKEGWGLFERRSGISLCYDNEANLLNDDNEAWDLVIRKAMTGSEFHIAVIAGIKQQNPEEYALWVYESRIYIDYHLDQEFANNKDQALKNLGL